MRRIFNLGKDESGATAVEYGLILSLVFLAMIVGLRNFADANNNMWSHVEDKVAKR